MQPRVAFLGALALLLVQPLQGKDFEQYVIKEIEAIDLGTLGGDESLANDINDVGEIVGWSLDAAGKQRAFIYRDNAMQNLLGLSTEHESVASGISNHTRVVGHFLDPAHQTEHAFYWRSPSTQVLLDESVDADPAFCATGSRAKAINDYGEITGVRIVGCNPPVAFINKAVRWKIYNSDWQDLVSESSPASYFVNDINNGGVIVGEETHGSFSWTGSYVWEAGTVSDVPTPTPDPPKKYWPSYQRALGINDAGNIVGSVYLMPLGSGASVTHPFWWSGATTYTEELPIFKDTVDSIAYEINKQGFISGFADRKIFASLFRLKHAVIWHPDFGIALLPAPSKIDGKRANAGDCEALTVNDRNEAGVVQAAGYCRFNGKYRAILWNISIALVTTQF